MMGREMRRRDFVTFLGGAAVTPSILWSLVARAQQLQSIGHGKHIVMVNVEADVVAGPLLAGSDAAHRLDGLVPRARSERAGPRPRYSSRSLRIWDRCLSKSCDRLSTGL